MRVTVTTPQDDNFVLDVSPDLELENFKTFCHLETGYPVNQMLVNHNGKCLTEDKKSLKDIGISNGDILFIHQVQTNYPTTSGRRRDKPTTSRGHEEYSDDPNSRGFSSKLAKDPAHVRDLILSNPDQLALIKQNNPRLSAALNTGKLDIFAKVLNEQMAEREKRERQKIKLMNAHPFDVEAQRLIAEEIRQKNVDANMEAAIEFNPETFGSVVMLYINCKVNGYPVKAFVDSGAQTTIMSKKCAERCDIMRLVDYRWAGVAKGVGIQRILGRIHMVQVAIEKDFLTTSLSILNDQPMDMLLGLDMLKRHQCNIDLKKNVLRIGTTGTETKFLPERELPESARLTSAEEEDDEDYY